MPQFSATSSTRNGLAEMVWRAAHDRTGKLRFPAGPDAVALVGMRRG